MLKTLHNLQNMIERETMNNILFGGGGGRRPKSFDKKIISITC